MSSKPVDISGLVQQAHERLLTLHHRREEEVLRRFLQGLELLLCRPGCGGEMLSGCVLCGGYDLYQYHCHAYAPMDSWGGGEEYTAHGTLCGLCYSVFVPTFVKPGQRVLCGPQEWIAARAERAQKEAERSWSAVR